MNRWLEKIARHIPPAIYRLFVRRSFIPYFYHLISDNPPPHFSSRFPYKTSEMFEHDLQYLKENCTVVTYPQLADHLINGAPLGKNAVHLSFDDGMAECYTVARPLLLKYDLPCTFFVTTNVIDNQALLFRHKVALCMNRMRRIGDRELQDFFNGIEHRLGTHFSAIDEPFTSWLNSLKAGDLLEIDCLCELLEIDEQAYLREHAPYLTTNQIQTLIADGFTIGAHSCSHPLLCDLEPEDLRYEIVDATHVIHSITGTDRIPFAFPFYGAGIPLDQLEKIHAEDDRVGLFFDTNGIARGRGLVIDRIWADAPEWDHTARSTLPLLLHLTYQNMLLNRLRSLHLYS